MGKIINRYQVAKHFHLLITDNTFSYERNSDKIEAEAKLDGMYVIRTSVSESVLDDSKTVKTYKSLSQLEQAFRCYTTIDLNVRPIYHRASSSGASARVFMPVGLLRGMAYAGEISVAAI
ncbi:MULTISPECIES: hypothetical protein [unclassified Microcoleus]|uniref:hypothetical protein n=1 Tax=unclassified Microcoleus TaxID=2642155 RepID=UPI00403FBABE